MIEKVFTQEDALRMEPTQGPHGLDFVIPEGYTHIDNRAFDDFGTSISSISIPASVVSIGYPLFEESSVGSIKVHPDNPFYHSDGNCLIETESKTLIRGFNDSIIPNDGSVTAIADYAFDGCRGLKSITIPDSVTSIGRGAFNDCEELTDINLSNNITDIEDRTFFNCFALKTISIPDGVVSIGDLAFNRCLSLESITIPDSVTSIGEAAFEDCEKLANINLSENITSIEDYTFNHCGSLEEIVIPYGVDTIGNSAFSCTGLTDITIPDSVRHIGGHAFEYCKDLGKVNIGNGVTHIEPYTFAKCKSLHEVDLGSGLLKIGSYAFDRCGELTNITIPENVKKIDNYAFYACTYLTATMEGKNTIVEINAFEPDAILNADGLIEGKTFTRDDLERLHEEQGENIVIPEGYTDIDEYAFGHDWLPYKLSSITFPKSMEMVSSRMPFSVDSINVHPDNPVYHSDGNCLIETESKTLIRGGNNCKIPDDGSVVNIADYAFEGSAAEFIGIPDGIKTIGSGAFSESCIKSVTLPDSVTSIGKDAFYNCEYLTEVHLSNNISVIPDGAFALCHNLEEIVIPNNVTDIATASFADTGLKEVGMSDNIETIGRNAFLYCRLAEITVNGDTFVHEDAFDVNVNRSENERGIKVFTAEDAERLVEEQGNYIVIPKGYTHIDDHAFDDCHKDIESIIVPSTVKYIGSYDFLVRYCGLIIDPDKKDTPYEFSILTDRDTQTCEYVPRGYIDPDNIGYEELNDFDDPDR